MATKGLARLWIGAGAIATVVGLMTSTAQAGCAHWDISGHWAITQSNGITVTMDLTQTGTNIQGNAAYRTRVGSGGPFIPFGTTISGQIAGTIDDNNNILLTADWDGVYRGGVGSDAFFGGDTSNPAQPDVVASWRSDGPAKCLVAATPPSQAPPHVTGIGKRKNPTHVTGIGKKKIPPPDAGPAGGQTAAAINATDVYTGNDGKSPKICAMNVGDKGSVLGYKEGQPDWAELSNITGECNGAQGWVWNGGDLSIQ